MEERRCLRGGDSVPLLNRNQILTLPESPIAPLKETCALLAAAEIAIPQVRARLGLKRERSR